jgi:formamidopyrimidine-DNA glycosylase
MMLLTIPALCHSAYADGVPEGDSIYRAARRLDRGLAGGELVRTDFRVPQHATADLSGQSILATESHGKHLFTRTDAGITLHSHQGMDGSWSVVRPGKHLPRRMLADVRVILEVSGGTTAYGLALPVVDLIATKDEPSITDHLGPDPLRDDWDLDEATRRLLSRPERPLVEALLDQRNLAGLGNLWVNETCFLRGYSPWTPVGDTDVVATVRLAARMLRYSAFGPSAAQVTTGVTRPGHEHWVYGRTRELCRRCGTPVRHLGEVPGDAERRHTWWCPHCQPGQLREGAGASPRHGAGVARDR